ncbi:uncharacterized protein LDX57_012053 [Aspergillus melleus]|uniref:uncharacterized protein n=1 Tax=Aspergillus melleus TaxID=138277 RepID=UPI001E8DE233|nr:uncharacterized protein LDX57_012053 [Aspergillus melleus]KAH8434406.1 hypothetical protein LDX57_012053 [Aspergillus melleus]
MSSITSHHPQALVFDLMGTCTDWKTSICTALSQSPSLGPRLEAKQAEFAADWRAGFFDEIHARFQSGAGSEDIDLTHRRVLDRLLRQYGIDDALVDETERERLVLSWHSQVAWPDAVEAISRLKEQYTMVVLANGTTRLQLDIIRSSGLPFHTLFSSQLLGLTKPDPAIYRKALDLLQVSPHEAAMVAAHAYDLRAAKQVGMRTVYIRRDTEDPDENMDAVRRDVDLFLDHDSSQDVDRGPLVKLADHLL